MPNSKPKPSRLAPSPGILLLSFLCMTLLLSACESPPKKLSILHFSDYHSNAVAQKDAQANEIGGIARAIAYLKANKNASTLIFSGGDMMNRGAPAWSDKYRCAEWVWLNGLVDAMALGNHDSDYGPEVFAECRAQITYPILSANTVDGDGTPLFRHQDKNYSVYQRGGFKVGVFALAGPDFNSLISPELLPVAGANFTDRDAVAQIIVEQLRLQEEVDLVVLIGHAHFEDDVSLAQNVAGIDLILGTHSHREKDLFQIPNTASYYISSGQYLAKMSRVEIDFSVQGGLNFKAQLVAMDHKINPDPGISKRVAKMQIALQSDSLYADEFNKIGESSLHLKAPTDFVSDTSLGNYLSDLARHASQSDVALFTSSTFRKDLPKGVIREHHLKAALPYDNRLFVYTLSGAQLRQLIEVSTARIGSDFFSQVSGLSLVINQGELQSVMTTNSNGSAPILDDQLYRVVTSDFQAIIAAGYKEIFAEGSYEASDLTLRQLLRNELAKARTIAVDTNRIQVR